MARFLKDRTSSKGMVPGSMILIGNQKMDKPVIRQMQFDAENLEEREPGSLDEAADAITPGKVTWINVYGLHDMPMMERVQERFGIHPLLMEDILNTDQRPIFVEDENYNAFILKMFEYDEKEKSIHTEQFTLILGPHYVLTLQEQTGDVLEPVRERIRSTKIRIRLIDPDYLAYALLDTLVDKYILLIEQLGREVEAVEKRLFTDPTRPLVEEIYRLKTEFSYIRKSVRPVREVMSQLLKSDLTMFQDKYRHYLTDLHDLVVQSTEAIELYSGMILDHLNIYQTHISNRSNEVMKVLTIFAAIFIPLTFLAGIYGMNFKYIPELEFRYSYPIFWGVVVIIAVALLLYFRRKKWF